MGVFQSVWYRFALVFFAVYLTVFWFVLGPGNPWYAVGVVWGTCSLVPAVPGFVMRRVPLRWVRVPAGERVLHRIAGVGIFGWALDACGWNRCVAEPLRGFSGNRAGLLLLQQQARAGAVSHGICFAIHALLAVLARFGRSPWIGAVWMLAPGVVVHLYPVLLQRSIMLRIQPLLARRRE